MAAKFNIYQNSHPISEGPMPQLEFVPHVKVTDLLTSISVLFAASTLIYTWTKDRGLRSKEYADRIRSAASLTLSKVDRCQNLFQSITDTIQPAITEIDGMMVDFKDAVKCRDHFWKRLHELRTSMMDTFREEQIEVAYAPLFVYNSSIYNLFENSMKFSKAAEAASFAVLQEKCQAIILNIHPLDATTAVLGNALRLICAEHGRQSREDFNVALLDVREFLKSILTKNDKELLHNREYLLGNGQPKELEEINYWIGSWAKRPSQALSSLLKQHDRVTDEDLRRSARACESVLTIDDPGALRLWRGWGSRPKAL